MCMCVVIPVLRWEPYLVPKVRQRKKDGRANTPEYVARANTKAKGDGNIAPEGLSEFSGDGCDGHC